MSLKKLVIKGIAWSSIAQGFKQASQFVITIILARLLSPDDFGLIAMAIVFINFATIFSEMGVGNALIQRKELDQDHLSSAFWLNLIVGALLFLIVWISSPLVAYFYNETKLILILRLMSLSFVFAGFGIVQQASLTRSMNFKAIAIRDVIAAVTSGVVGILMAIKGMGVWSLVIQHLSFYFLHSIILWLFSSWRPKFLFSRKAIKDIYHFSLNVTGFNLVNCLARNIDYLLIGKFLGAEPLGYYTIAYKLMVYPVQNITWVINKVMFPAFSKIQAELEKVCQNYLKVIKSISLITFPMMAGIFIVADSLIKLLYGEKWGAVIPLIKIFVFCGMIQSVLSIGGVVYMSLGRVRLQFILSIIHTTILFITLLSFVKFGIMAITTAYTVFYFLWLNVSFFVLSKLLRIKIQEFYSRLVPAAAISLFMSTILLGINRYLNFTDTINLSILVLLGITIYTLTAFFLKQISYQQLQKL